MDLNIKSVNNGYVIYDENGYQPGMCRLGETTHVACDIDGLCAVIRKIYQNREAQKQPSPEIK